MNIPAYDVLREDPVQGPAWIEAVADFQQAKARAQQLAAKSPGQYIVFSQKTGKVVARVNAKID